YQRLRFGNFDPATEANAFERRKRQQQRLSLAEADDLAEHAALAPGEYVAAIPDRKMMLNARDFDQQPLHASYAPEDAMRCDGFNAAEQMRRIG
ncbi:MAG: hypothetical protein M3N08_01545, partial [Pseudomonadota bacterium]|nr:hypothetical protein [Pseudomonadota bacterium]